MSKGKKIIVSVLTVLLVLSIALNVYILGFLKKDVKDNKPKEENPVVENNPSSENPTDENNLAEENPVEETPVVENNTKAQFPLVKVKNLNKKLSQLDFSNKTSSTSGQDDDVPFTISIDNGSINVKNESGSYSINIENPVSVGSGFSVQGNGASVFYIMTQDGKVYMVDNGIDSTTYEETPKDLGITNATSIAVVDQNFNLNEKSDNTVPTVYIKTSDGKVLTNEYFMDNVSIVEVVEQ